jgi:3-dehydroquinate synthase
MPSTRIKIKSVDINKLGAKFAHKMYVVITDDYIYSNYPTIFENIEHVIVLRKHNKDINVFQKIIGKLIELGANKNTMLVGIGGGALTDLVGFVASVFGRGLRLILIPTTLLAMVDAAIGGKNALNYENIKNVIGTIYHPTITYIIPDFLDTLPRRELLSGIAEIIKIGLLCDNELLEQCEQYLDETPSNDDTKTLMHTMIFRSIEYKTHIIAKDVNDTNERMLLNFGHTIGHSLELLYDLPHGYAVAYGMQLEIELAVSLGMTDKKSLQQINDIVHRYYSPTPTFIYEQIAVNVEFDKKMRGNNISMPILQPVGKPQIVPIPKNIIKEFLMNKQKAIFL